MKRQVCFAGRIVTAIDDEIIRDGAVIVEGDRIAWVGRRGDLAPSATESGAILDFGARYSLLPGLIDAHVHLGFDAGPSPVSTMSAADDEQLLSLMRTTAAHCLEAGITTVRDLGSRGTTGVQLRDLLAAGESEGPRVVVAGRPLTTPGGHCWYMGGECADVSELVAEVDRNHADGADLIKVMATGGFLTPGTTPGAPQFDEEALRAVATRAKHHGMRVAAHAHGTLGIASAVAAGVDSIEHCSWVGPHGLDFDPRVAESMAARGVYVCPTVNKNARNPRGRLPWEQRAEHISALHQAGVPVVAGTDAGIEHIGHQELWSGLEILSDAGLRPLEVIRSTTSLAASALSVGDETGSIRPGLSADLIAVAGDPTSDLTALRLPAHVILRGCTVKGTDSSGPEYQQPPDAR